MRELSVVVAVFAIAVGMSGFFVFLAPFYPLVSFSPGCYDSDSSLNSNFVKGEVLVDGQSYSDSCRSSDVLAEAFCVSDKVEFGSIECSSLGDYLCSDGKCVPSSHTICSDRSFCLSVLGPGVNECQRDSDCG